MDFTTFKNLNLKIKKVGEELQNDEIGIFNKQIDGVIKESAAWLDSFKEESIQILASNFEKFANVVQLKAAETRMSGDDSSGLKGERSDELYTLIDQVFNKIAPQEREM